MTKNLTEVHRSAAITGAGSGLGRDLALGLAAKGYRVFGTALSPEEVSDLDTTSGGHVSLAVCDITDAAIVKAWVRQVSNALGDGGLDVLTSNAGILTPGLLEVLSLDAIRHEFEVNVFVAPQAPGGNAWYPYSFLAPIEQNEPWLSRSLATVESVVDSLAEQGFGTERVVLLGFSQGGCRGLEHAARNATRYGAVIGLSAGLIGPEGVPMLSGTPVFLGFSDSDAHIPLSRVHETSGCLRALAADVVERIYRGDGHTINDDDVRQIRGLLAKLLRPASPPAAERTVAS